MPCHSQSNISNVEEKAERRCKDTKISVLFRQWRETERERERERETERERVHVLCVKERAWRKRDRKAEIERSGVCPC